ncbi:MAG: FHA domain-containing protein [Chloroflexota bacterium]|nr:FHA domain-containing protein [Chloroflexota bacterium]
MIECPCGKYKIDEKAQLCPYCGIVLKAKQHGTTALISNEEQDGVPRWGTARFNSRMNLIFRVRETGAEFVFDASGMTQIIIGRLDHDTGEKPDVDLTAHGAVDLGVSRKHVTILRKEEGSLTIIDRAAQNGTFLNGNRLVANQARILRDGDELRLGKLVLLVRFERSK